MLTCFKLCLNAYMYVVKTINLSYVIQCIMTCTDPDLVAGLVHEDPPSTCAHAYSANGRARALPAAPPPSTLTASHGGPARMQRAL